MGSLGYRFAIGLILLCGTVSTMAQEPDQRVELSGSGTSSSTKVTSVYGISADDYLPSVKTLKKRVRPHARSASSRPTFELPDACYFIGAPIFIILLIRVLVIFLNEFEEKRREEQRRNVAAVAKPE